MAFTGAGAQASSDAANFATDLLRSQTPALRVISRYVFRGFAYSQGPVNQTTAWVAISGFSFYAWGNFLINREPQQRKFGEIDFGVSYKRDRK